MNFKKGFIIFISLVILLAVITVSLFWRWPGITDSFAEENDFIRQDYHQQISGYFGPTRLSLLTKHDATGYHNYLELRPLFGTIKKIELSGFEAGLAIVNTYEIGDNSYLIISGDVAVHSRNLVVVRASKNRLEIINFINDKISTPNILSDWPEFETKMNAGSLDIVSFYRDYEKDPLSDTILSTYSLRGGSLYYQSVN